MNEYEIEEKFSLFPSALQGNAPLVPLQVGKIAYDAKEILN